MKWNKLVPYDKAGNLMSYAEAGATAGWYAAARWEPVTEVDAEMIFIGFERGRSKVNAIFKDQAGRTFTMFLSDFSEAIPKMKNGLIKGTFSQRKHGANYGLSIVNLE